MGWERKRGKLRELNHLLRGATDTSFLPLDGGAAPPAGIRYVITLDADTRLPREAARQLVGTIAHPLNRPIFDSAAGRFVEGHPILQPRVAPTLPETGFGTLFQLIFSGPRGIDPYAFAVSDVYQDLFGEGIYTGKGIYDVDAFERALADRVPENTQLSHDLFEGLFARAGFVSDIELFEGFPGHYEVAASRQHRWVRGDWQLLPWILGRGPRASRIRTRDPADGPLEDGRQPSTQPFGSRDVCDAGRRMVPPGSRRRPLERLRPGGSRASNGPFLFHEPSSRPRKGVAKRSFVRGVAADLGIGLAQTALRIVLLAHAAWLRVDAIARTLWRLTVTRRHLLEWVPAAQAHRALDLEVSGFYRRMRSAVVLAVLCGAGVVASGTGGWKWAAPFIALWLASPWIARWISLPPHQSEGPLITAAQSREFRRIARRTWRYFERFMGPDSHGLPSDNFQEMPQAQIARRTSPTNIGLALLSTVAANDFGWIGTDDMARRLEATLDTLGKLERFRGHFFNWYDTENLKPLEPRYVSTVDSGNLAAHLIALRQACLERLDEPIPCGARSRGHRRHARAAEGMSRFPSPGAQPGATS